MAPPNDPSIDRRRFLGSVAATTAGLAVTSRADASEALVRVPVAADQVMPEFAAWHVGMIAAYRRDLSIDANRSRNGNLAADLCGGYYHIHGTYLERCDAEPVEEHSFLLLGQNGDDSGKMKGLLRTLSRKFDQDRFIYKPFYKDVELHIWKQDNPKKWDVNTIGPFHPNRIGDLHVLITRGGLSAFSENIPQDSNGVDWRGGQWLDVGCWSRTSFFSREPRRILFETEPPS